MTNDSTRYKEPLWMLAWLDAALEKEKEKYEKCPVLPDVVPDYEVSQGWGFVVVGYFLVEEALKAILHIREKEVPPIHALSTLFELLEEDDKEVLREYYMDYRETIGDNRGQYPFESIDDFLTNLDGDKNERGNHIGSFDWRYFLIEEERSQQMPSVSVDYLHEISYGCIRIFEYAKNGRFDPYESTHSWRLRWQRCKKQNKWLDARLAAGGLDGLGDRLEILWGPDYKDRYDLYVFQDKGINSCFSTLPDNPKLQRIDKRQELATLFR